MNYLIAVEKSEFATAFKTLIGSVFDLKKEQNSSQKALQKDEQKAILIEKQLTDLLAEVLDDKKCPQTAVFQSAMIKCREYLLTCLYHLEVAPDNNASQRAIRIIKVKLGGTPQKVSGQFKTGQQTCCVIRSVIDTLIKRKVELIQNIQVILNLQPE